MWTLHGLGAIPKPQRQSLGITVIAVGGGGSLNAPLNCITSSTSTY